MGELEKEVGEVRGVVLEERRGLVERLEKAREAALENSGCVAKQLEEVAPQALALLERWRGGERLPTCGGRCVSWRRRSRRR